MKFLSPFKYDDYCRGLWITTEWICFEWRGRLFRFPPGFVTDMFSIPWFLRWWRQNNRGRGNEAAGGVHDPLSRFRNILGLTMKETDEAFLDAMDLLDFGFSGRVKYRAVRIGAYLGLRSDGWGKPPRKERRAMREAGDDWREYAKIVEIANRENNYAA